MRTKHRKMNGFSLPGRSGNFGTGVMEYPNPGVRIVSFGVQGRFSGEAGRFPYLKRHPRWSPSKREGHAYFQSLSRLDRQDPSLSTMALNPNKAVSPWLLPFNCATFSAKSLT